ncbi:hypothetical protein HDG32_004800 [Paraburkholderia sp. CI2]|nr:hypothetical protein [Paraburkholderia sp. CI2]
MAFLVLFPRSALHRFFEHPKGKRTSAEQFSRAGTERGLQRGHDDVALSHVGGWNVVSDVEIAQVHVEAVSPCLHHLDDFRRLPIQIVIQIHVTGQLVVERQPGGSAHFADEPSEIEPCVIHYRRSSG